MFTAKAIDKEMHGLQNAQSGPEAKEYNLLRADEEYRNGNMEHSIYYQVRALFQNSDARLITEAQQLENCSPTVEEILAAASAKEKEDYKSNAFFRNILKYNQKYELEHKKSKPKTKEISLDKLDFLEEIQEPVAGFASIASVCRQLPQEWCVLQLCKSFNPATTCSTYYEIAGSKGDIYLSLLQHCRSPELGPICLRFDNAALVDIFKRYGTLVERFKRVVTVDPTAVKTSQQKSKYWNELNAYSDDLQELINDLKRVFAPYNFLFLGKRYHCASLKQNMEQAWASVDELCAKLNWSNQQRILLSQAVLHANRFDNDEQKALSLELANYKTTEAQQALQLLKLWSSNWSTLQQEQPLAEKRFPLLLVVDERLDHMHWEQLMPLQECTRFKSLHSLWRLYKCHKAQVQHGYYTVRVERHGMSIINPESDLVKSGQRMRSFLEYWLPHWQHMFETKPTEQLLTDQAFKADCFVYAGHGSSLQYVSSRVIYRNRIKGVVFLFGCDSTRVMSSGLYSPLYGAHDYYHGALCPTVVGTLMPALDGNMDNIATNLLSRWIAPANGKVTPWTQIDRVPWISQGTIKALKGVTQTVDQVTDYQVGSLCSILAGIQQGKVEPKVYNYCVYVSRGLPAWNLAVEKLPFSNN
ncbi:LOW QUALITY PROTEIN: uncharacterized protein LOC133842958 [Drosophila sulfurigaster albostrigata]|uniref:LOW QUALITY PROTEIN: uncharacterized protein LOC133842958 n=1 Tax=Drosophila sulfurigaster albostrigata TaxID=89887 RepID=UPI002D21D6B2|nr:LOW QUALITY PROTEIN: uncharacterized protein LOC133842958 [Drosophila sulfurigaster albostrigata]